MPKHRPHKIKPTKRRLSDIERHGIARKVSKSIRHDIDAQMVRDIEDGVDYHPSHPVHQRIMSEIKDITNGKARKA